MLNFEITLPSVPNTIILTSGQANLILDPQHSNLVLEPQTADCLLPIFPQSPASQNPLWLTYPRG